MSNAYLTRLPLVAGGLLAGQAGRAGLWALNRYFRAPGTNTAILALMTVTAMAASNALYSQHDRHPSPLFGGPASAVEAPTPQKRVAPKLVQTTSIVRPATTEIEPAATPVAVPKAGNADLAQVQQKLKAMNLFAGTVDGYYGPKTAAAIRAFEQRVGLKPTGKASPSVVAAILDAPVVQAAQQQPLQLQRDDVETAAMPAARPTPASALERVEAQDLPAPAPLVAPRRPDAKPISLDVDKPASREGAANASEPDLLNAIADRAAGAFEAIADLVGDVAGPRQPMPKPLAAESTEIAYRPAAKVEQPQQLDTPAETNRELVTRVQRGLASLGFLGGKIDGVAGAATAKAIRNFEVYYSYDVTGRVSLELLRLLKEAGATI